MWPANTTELYTSYKLHIIYRGRINTQIIWLNSHRKLPIKELTCTIYPAIPVYSMKLKLIFHYHSNLQMNYTLIPNFTTDYITLELQTAETLQVSRFEIYGDVENQVLDNIFTQRHFIFSSKIYVWSIKRCNKKLHFLSYIVCFSI